MNDIHVVILSVAICVAVLAFAAVYISYLYRRRRSLQELQEKPSPFKPSYNLVSRPISGVDLLGNAMGPGMSPVTPTEFFGAGKGVTLYN